MLALKISDKDNDGILNDKELNDFQVCAPEPELFSKIYS